ncbi:MAG: transcriptional activator NhaR [Myxococcota bacterium]
MEWLNYHHLLYFWTVAKEGSVTKAAKALSLTQPTISGQIRSLEESLGEKLFQRVGRGLELTEVGTVVFRYADDIFRLGRELQDTLKGRPMGKTPLLQVGISDLLPKLISYRLLAPALAMAPAVRIVCQENKTERLLADLSIHGLDLVLSDEPLGSHARVRAYNHLLGESGVSVFATRQVAGKYRADFPYSLDNAPMLLPTENTPLRRSLEHWFEEVEIRPMVTAEFEDSALLKVFGQHGAGLFAAASVIEKDIERQYGLEVVGRTEEVRERFYAISVERRIKHPAVAEIRRVAQETLFAGVN